MQRWYTVAVETGIPWPDSETQIDFEGHQLFLRPGTEKTAPCVDLLFDDPMTDEEAHTLLTRFMSALCWVERYRIRETMASGGSVFRLGFGYPNPIPAVTPQFCADYLPSPADARARLGLALYREAMNVNAIPYQFLGFFKVINILHGKGADQTKWIAATIPKITDYRATQRLQELSKTKSDVAEYMYESGRCAVAHAWSQPIVNPDDQNDLRRLAADLPLIQALAEYVIDHELGVKSRSTVRHEHLYELAGFKRLVGPALTRRLQAGESPPVSDFPDLPRITIQLRDHDRWPTFEGLSVRVEEVEQSRVLLDCHASKPLLCLKLLLDFPGESAIFHPYRHMRSHDDGSTDAVRAAIECNEMLAGFLGNGALEILDAGTGELLSRRDPHIPKDIDLNRTLDAINSRISHLKHVLANRTTTAVEKKGPS